MANAIDAAGIAPYVVRYPSWSVPRLQLMILLSALLASLTGLVSGERPVPRAQVEQSAAAAVSQARVAAVQAGIRPDQAQPLLQPRAPASFHSVDKAPVHSGRTRLTLKQSWLN